MAEYAISQRSGQPKNVNFELIIRGLKYDVFDWDQVKHHKGCGQVWFIEIFSSYHITESFYISIYLQINEKFCLKSILSCVMMFNIFCIWREKRSWLKAGNFMVLWAHQGISTEPLGPLGILKILNLFQPRSHHLHTLYSLSFLKRLRVMNKEYNMKIFGSNNLGLFNIAFRP